MRAAVARATSCAAKPSASRGGPTTMLVPAPPAALLPSPSLGGESEEGRPGGCSSTSRTRPQKSSSVSALGSGKFSFIAQAAWAASSNGVFVGVWPASIGGESSAGGGGVGAAAAAAAAAAGAPLPPFLALGSGGASGVNTGGDALGKRFWNAKLARCKLAARTAPCTTRSA